jgi:hypothetical protein
MKNSVQKQMSERKKYNGVATFPYSRSFSLKVSWSNSPLRRESVELDAPSESQPVFGGAV